ncbi:hypothetical protein FRB95_011293 [Tulasnella sp. JGI-2019a]|nr:hypothetical protein FRB95_011293 [Tulasnella sp. JGI-2019a]
MLTGGLRRRIARPYVRNGPDGSSLRFLSLTSASTSSRQFRFAPHLPLDIHEKVKDALETGQPVVALESAIITHGLPRPINLHTARSLERIVRSTGSIPATIAVLNGRLTVGLTSSQLEYLAEGSKSGDTKVSRRDIAPILARGKGNGNGGTTISGTMVIADMVGIKVFATGGLGGVHRGGEITWDVSADLTELGRTPVAVVTAGAKSILDIGRTLEYLETQGATVATYGPTKDFPAFFSRTSGFQSPWSVETPKDAAKMIYMANMVGLSSGQLFAVPIPEEHEEAGKRIQAFVDRAVAESEANGMSRTGKDATPWLLNRVRELTGGESVKNNIALVENTALVGGQIAVELAKMSRGSTQTHITVSENEPPVLASVTIQSEAKLSPRLIIMGASAVDITSRLTQSAVASTSPGTVTLTSGGVGRNMAEAAHRHRSPFTTHTATTLITVLGDDLLAGTVRTELDKFGIDLKTLRIREAPEPVRTPVCSLLLEGDGSLVGGVADFDAVRDVRAEEAIQALEELFGSHVHGARKPLVAIDANFSDDVIKAVLQWCWEGNVPFWFEPTSVPKCTSILRALFTLRKDTRIRTSPAITYASPNSLELEKMYDMVIEHDGNGVAIGSKGLVQAVGTMLEVTPGDLGWQWLKQEGTLKKAVILVGEKQLFKRLVIKCGERGVLLVMTAPSHDLQHWETDITPRRIIVPSDSRDDHIILEHFPAHSISPGELVSTTGAGDSLVGTLLSEESAALMGPSGRSIFSDPARLTLAMDNAQAAAVRALKSSRAVADT